MVVLDHAVEFLQQLFRFVLVHLVDAFGKLPDREDTSPASHWMGPDDRMDRGEAIPFIQGASPLSLYDLLPSTFHAHAHAIGSACDGQAIYKVLIRLGQAIIQLIARGPKRIAAGFGQFDDAE